MDAKTVFLFFVLIRLCTRALPVYDGKEDKSCINMTPERAKELNKIGEEVNNFINDLSDKHENFDFVYIELRVENHSDDEDDDKETTLKITVKDCNNKAVNHPKVEDKYFENYDHDSNKFTSKNKSERKTTDEHYETKSRNVSNKTSRTESRINQTIKNESYNEEINNVDIENKSTKTSNKVRRSKSIESESLKSDLGSESKKIVKDENREEKDGADNEETSRKKNSKKNGNRNNSNDKNTSSKNEKRIQIFSDDGEDQDGKKHHTFIGDFDNSNTVIFAPLIDNTKIEIYSDYAGLLKLMNDKYPNVPNVEETPLNDMQAIYGYHPYVNDAYKIYLMNNQANLNSNNANYGLENTDELGGNEFEYNYNTDGKIQLDNYNKSGIGYIYSPGQHYLTNQPVGLNGEDNIAVELQN